MKHKDLKFKLQEANAKLELIDAINKHIRREKEEKEKLFEIATWEFSNEKYLKEQYFNLLCDIQDLLEKWVNPNLISKVIQNWKEKWILTQSIHNDLLFKK